jgi:hypothetical protein
MQQLALALHSGIPNSPQGFLGLPKTLGEIRDITNFRGADAKKIAAIAAALLPTASGELTSAHGFVQLCPDCRNVLTQGQYFCSSCGFTFKNEISMVLRSILLPGGDTSTLDILWLR